MEANIESMVSDIRSKIVKETQKELIKRFRATFGKSVTKHAQDIVRTVYPCFSEPNVLIHEEYKYQDRVFLRVEVVLDQKSETKYTIKFN